MSKRKLSLQQKRRIAEQREKRKSQRLANDRAKLENEQQLGELEDGLVIAHFGHEVLVRGEQQEQKCHVRANLELCTGDRVSWRAGTELGVVESCAPRQTEIQRPDIYGKLRSVAANVSQLIITIAPQPEPHANLIDRYLVAAHIHKLQPLILLNKADLALPETLLSMSKQYSELGYQVLEVSASKGQGLSALSEKLCENTSIFVGQSGVGKSSIIQSLLPNEEIRIGALSSAANKGRHTTTNSQLYHFSSGGYCIDSPGIREFGLWHASPEEVLASFPELAAQAEMCRFRDCAHRSEPGCAIRAALDEGKICAKRFASYQSILNQLGDVTIKTQSGIKQK